MFSKMPTYAKNIFLWFAKNSLFLYLSYIYYSTISEFLWPQLPKKERGERNT